MVDLGPGTRVYIGYTPDWRFVDGANGTDGRCRTGTITEGPFEPGKLYRDKAGDLYETTRVMFNVDVDGGGAVAAASRILFPIDDGTPDDTPVETEEPPEVALP